MKLENLGLQVQVFDSFREYALKSDSHRAGQYQWGKKTKVFYREAYRRKNTGKKWGESNTESLSLEIDTNLSEDFRTIEIDIQTGESLELVMFETDQPEYGNTCLKVEERYIDKEQRLFVNRHWHYCKTIGGTVGKRIDNYKKEFEWFANSRIQNFKDNKFEVFFHYTKLNIAQHFWFNRGKWNIYYDSRDLLNQLLVLFSILSGNSLEVDSEFDLWMHPLSIRNEQLNDFKPVFLPALQIEIADRVRDLVAKVNQRTILEIFEKSITKYQKYDYQKIEKEILKLI